MTIAISYGEYLSKIVSNGKAIDTLLDRNIKHKIYDYQSLPIDEKISLKGFIESDSYNRINIDNRRFYILFREKNTSILKDAIEYFDKYDTNPACCFLYSTDK